MSPRWYTIHPDGSTAPLPEGVITPPSLIGAGAKTTVRGLWGTAQVSTVFLGRDHGCGEGPPILFETMIFGGYFHKAQWRRLTFEESCRGHVRAVWVARIAAWLLPPFVAPVLSWVTSVIRMPKREG